MRHTRFRLLSHSPLYVFPPLFLLLSLSWDKRRVVDICASTHTRAKQQHTHSPCLLVQGVVAHTQSRDIATPLQRRCLPPPPGRGSSFRRSCLNTTTTAQARSLAYLPLPSSLCTSWRACAAAAWTYRLPPTFSACTYAETSPLPHGKVLATTTTTAALAALGRIGGSPLMLYYMCLAWPGLMYYTRTHEKEAGFSLSVCVCLPRPRWPVRPRSLRSRAKGRISPSLSLHLCSCGAQTLLSLT